MIRIVPSYVAGLILGALALMFGIGSHGLGYWTEDGPGPGLLPLAASALLLPLLFVAMREPEDDEDGPIKAGPVVAVAATTIYALVLPYTGFVIATIVLLAFWIRAFFSESFTRTILASFGLTAVGLFIFQFLLRVPMQLFPVMS